MAVVTTQFRDSIPNILNAKASWDADAIKCALVTAQSFAFDTDQYWDVATAHYTEVASGGGYTTGGVALSGMTDTYTPASSWATAWSAAAWAVGQIVKGTGSGASYLFMCVTAGTSTGSIPAGMSSAPVAENTYVVDSGGVGWVNVGKGVTVITATAASWSSATISAIGAVVYDSTPGSNKPLIAYIDFGGTLASTSATFQVSFDPTYGLLSILEP